MCRLFGAISEKPLDASYFLVRASRSLLTQSAIDRQRKQGDGWGLGWFEKGQPRFFKSSEPIYNDKVRVEKVARQARGDVVMGHIRWASNPLKLPKRELIGINHSQPFAHGPWLFAHNGTLYIPREVAAALGPWAKYVQGHNDSEVLFYWLMKHLVKGGRPGGFLEAVRESIQGLHRIWESCKRRYPLYKYPYHGLNWVLTDGRILVGFCYVDPGGFSKAKALSNKKQPYYQLQVQRTDDAVTIASEPLTRENNWRPLGHGQLMTVRKGRRGLDILTQQVMR